MEDNMSDFIRHLRRQLGMTQEEFAHSLGITVGTVNRWENGHSSPTGTVLEVYRALDTALKSGKTGRQILGTESLDPGRLLLRIFRTAYGG